MKTNIFRYRAHARATSGKTFLGTILLSVLMVSCTTTKEQEAVFSIEKELFADSIPVQSIFDRRFMNVYGDYLVITSVQSDMTIHVYKTPELKLISEFGPKGHAANEIKSFPTLGASVSDTIYIRGFKHNVLTKILMVNNEPHRIGNIELEFGNTPNDICMISDSTLCFKDVDEHCISIYDFNKQEITKTQKTGDQQQNEADVIDPDMGCLAANDQTIVYAYQYKKQIKVFDASNLTPIKTITFPDEKENSDFQHSDLDQIPLHYTGGVATAQGFYMLYRGFTPNDTNSCCSIEFLDKNSNTQCRYKLDRKIFVFAVDEKNGYIYGCNDNQDYLYRYKFK